MVAALKLEDGNDSRHILLRHDLETKLLSEIPQSVVLGKNTCYDALVFLAARDFDKASEQFRAEPEMLGARRHCSG
jgi:hypothetical protein